MDSKYKLIVDSFGKDRFKFNEPLKDYTALKIGGPAKLFFIAFTTHELTKIIKMVRELGLPYFILGTGSKSMISDNGFDGIVIKNRTKNIQVVSIKGKVSKFGIGVEEAYVEVESGVSIGKFMEFLDLQKLSSGEFGGILGSIGGNLFLNAVLQSKLQSIKVLTLRSQIEEIEINELSFRNHIILSAVFKVKSKDM